MSSYGLAAKQKQEREGKYPIHQVVPMSTMGGGWVKDNNEMRWRKNVKKLKMYPGILIKLSKKIENDGGLVEKKPVDYMILNGQTTAYNNATVDGFTSDQVYDALYSSEELGKRFRLVEYTETQAEIERRAMRRNAVVSKKDQTLLEGSEDLANGKAASKFMNPDAATRNFTTEALQEAELHQMTVVGASSLPIVTDSGFITSEIEPLNE